MDRIEWQLNTTDSKVFRPFTDTTEEAKGEPGICGEKIVELDEDTPPFLTLTSGVWSYPNNADFTINFDDSYATENDIKVHIINYTVSLVEYDGIVSPHHGSFEFDIRCSTLMTSSETTIPAIVTIYYDIASL